jgi:hypothetical protein
VLDVEVEADVRVLAVHHVDLGEARAQRAGSHARRDEPRRVIVYACACFCVAAKAQNLHFTRQTFVWFKYRFWTK